MGFMIPITERFAAYHVETNVGEEIVPESVCGKLDDGTGENAMLTPYECAHNLDALEPYLEGSRIEGIERKEGWYARLSAPGYLDCTSWEGPFDSADDALRAVKDTHDVNDNGDATDGYDE